MRIIFPPDAAGGYGEGGKGVGSFPCRPFRFALRGSGEGCGGVREKWQGFLQIAAALFPKSGSAFPGRMRGLAAEVAGGFQRNGVSRLASQQRKRFQREKSSFQTSWVMSFDCRQSSRKRESICAVAPRSKMKAFTS